MKRILFSLLAVIAALAGQAQIDQKIPAYGIEVDRMRALRSLQIPTGPELKVDRKDSLKAQLKWKTGASSGLYVYDTTCKCWYKLSTGSVGGYLENFRRKYRYPGQPTDTLLKTVAGIDSFGVKDNERSPYPMSAWDSTRAEQYLGQWTNYPTPVDNVWVDVAYSHQLNIYVAVSHGSTTDGAMWSTDGQTWHLVSVQASEWRSVAWSPELGMFVAVSATGTNRVMYSYDGKSWTGVAAIAKGWRWVLWVPQQRQFVAVAYSGTGQRVMTSPDGITWTARTTPSDQLWNEVVYLPKYNRLLAVASDGTFRVMTSDDAGVTWVLQTGSSSTGTYNGIAYSPELNTVTCVATLTGGAPQTMYSTDGGVTWTEGTIPLRHWLDVDWSSELGCFTAVAGYGAVEGDDSTRIGISFDGIHWRMKQHGTDRNYRRIHWVPETGRFIVVAYSFSYDGGLDDLIMMSRPMDREPIYLNIYGRDSTQQVAGNVTFSGDSIRGKTVEAAANDTRLATTAWVNGVWAPNLTQDRIGVGSSLNKMTSYSTLKYLNATGILESPKANFSADGLYPNYTVGQVYVTHTSGNFGLIISRTGGTGGGNLTFVGLRGTDPTVKAALQVLDRIGNTFYRGIAGNNVSESNTHEFNIIVSKVGTTYLGTDMYIRGIDSATGTFGIKMVLNSMGAMRLGFSPTSSFIDGPIESAVLDLVSTNKAFYAPRMTAAQRLAIPGPVNGALVWDTDSTRFMGYRGAGWQGLRWTDEGAGGGSTDTARIKIDTTFNPLAKRIDSLNAIIKSMKLLERGQPIPWVGTDSTTTGTIVNDTTTVAAFNLGARNILDTAYMTDSTLMAYFHDGSDTLRITKLRIGLQGTSPNVTVTVYWNDSLNVTAGATKLINAGTAATNIYEGTTVTSFDNLDIPPGVWIWVKLTTVTTRPTFFSANLIGYKKRKA